MFIIILTALVSSFNLAITGPVILWQRMANIGDALSHALIASLILTFLGIDEFIATIIISIVFMLLVTIFSDSSEDRAKNLVIFSSLFISVTLLFADIFDGQFRIQEMITGDIISSGYHELFICAYIALINSTFIFTKLNKIVLVAISKDIALVNGINLRFLKFSIALILALTISVSIQITGILLLTSLLIIPASIAKKISNSPGDMVIKSAIIGCGCSLISAFISLAYDLSFSATNSAILVLSYIFSSLDINLIRAKFLRKI